MQFNSEFKFDVSLSNDSYSDKVISGAMIGTSKNDENRRIRKQYGFASNKGIGFVRTTVNSEQLLNSLLDGKVFCHLFNPASIRKDGTFGSSQKKDENFIGSNVIGVDIDHTSYNSAEEFIAKLSLKPTFYYTSYSNMQINEDGTSKGARFRLIYVFDEMILNPYFFRFCANKLNRIIEKDTDEPITDDCNLRCSQYFNGTNKNNPSVILSCGITDIIYSFNDIDVDGNGFIDFLCNYANYKTISKKRTEEITSLLKNITNNIYVFNKVLKKFLKLVDNHISSTTLNDKMESDTTVNFSIEHTENSSSSCFSNSIEVILNDWGRLDEEEFKKSRDWEEARRRTKYIYRVEKEWIDNLYQKVDDDYFSMFYYNSTQHDGQKRRKSLYQRMCLRRVINPDITEDEMVVNTIIDIMRFFDNSDKVLNSDYIRRNIESAFDVDVEDLKEQYKDTINYLKVTTKPKRGIIYNGREAHSKETTYLILDDYYNKNYSVSKNLDILNNELGYKIGKSTIYYYLEERGIKTDSNKVTDEELLKIIDVNLSKRENMKILKDNNIKCGDKRLLKLIKLKKDNIDIYNNISYNAINSSEETLLSTTLNVEMENDTTKENEETVISDIEYDIECGIDEKFEIEMDERFTIPTFSLPSLKLA